MTKLSTYRKLQDRNDVIVRVLNCERSTYTLHSVHIERKTCTGHTWWVVICIVCIVLHTLLIAHIIINSMNDYICIAHCKQWFVVSNWLLYLWMISDLIIIISKIASGTPLCSMIYKEV